MVRKAITLDKINLLETDDHDQLYWKGKAVVMEQRFTLGIVERWLAGLAAFATVVSALFPIVVHFRWFGW
ncbi:MAG: hypothetical protein ABIY37_09420 [Devosia sp.]